MATQLPSLPTINLTPQQREDVRKAEVAYLSDKLVDPKDKSRADLDRGDADQLQITLPESVYMFTHTVISPTALLHEMYRHAEWFGINNDIKV